MNDKKFRDIPCKRCGLVFSPRSGRTEYCDDCRPIHEHERHLKEWTGKRRRKGYVNPKNLQPWSEVVRICEENNLSYGKAKARGVFK